MCCTDMETWCMDNIGRIYRFVVYKKLFTPYEQEQKFVDESQFEDTCYRFGLIEEAVDLGNGEWMLGLREVCDGECTGYISYFKLGDIQLSYFDQDQDMLTADKDDN